MLEREQHAPRSRAAATPVNFYCHESVIVARAIVKCSMTAFTTLIDAATLAAQLHRHDLAIFDCRFDLANTGWGEAEYAAAHIPGATYAHLDRDLSGPVTPATGRHPLPDPHTFAQWLSAKGVSDDTQLIAYDQGNGAYAARLWWLARWVGLRSVAVLDGGFTAWRAGHLLLETEAHVRPPEIVEKYEQ